mgnify:CR=1 FL=1
MDCFFFQAEDGRRDTSVTGVQTCALPILDPSTARMVGHETEKTRSELIEMGFDKAIVETLPTSNKGSWDSPEKIARRDRTDETSRDPIRDKSQDIIVLREAYMKIDADGDGRSELRQIFTAGNQILSNEVVDRQPFHVISPQPLPHKHFGRATAEKVMDVQEVSSTLLRQVLDNLYHTNNPGKNVWEQAIGETTLDDLLTTRIGRIARFNRPVNEAYSTDVVPFTAAASFPMVEYYDKVKRDRTGIGSDSEGLSPDALKNIQQSVMSQATDSGKMKVEAIARIFAETGIKSLMLHIHELLLKHQQKEQVVMLRNQWVTVDPRSWRTRMDMSVSIGLGIGTREQNLMHLEAIWSKQKDIVMNGGQGTLVTAENIYNTAAEIVRNSNRKNPEMFFTKVDTIEPQTDPVAEQQMALAQRQQELDAQGLALKEQKMMIDAQNAQANTALKSEEIEKTMMVERSEERRVGREWRCGKRRETYEQENRRSGEDRHRKEKVR